MDLVYKFLLCFGVVFATSQAYSNEFQNEVYLEYGDISRKAITIHYSRVLLTNSDFISFRVFGHGGVTLTNRVTYPTIPVGIFLRTSDGEDNGVCFELGVQAVIGEVNTEEEFGAIMNLYKRDVIDFPIVFGPVIEMEHFVWKALLGYIINTSKGKFGTVGINMGFRF